MSKEPDRCPKCGSDKDSEGKYTCGSIFAPSLADTNRLRLWETNRCMDRAAYAQRRAITVGTTVSVTQSVPPATWIEPGTQGVVIEVVGAEIMGEELYVVQIGNHKIAYTAQEIIPC